MFREWWCFYGRGRDDVIILDVEFEVFMRFFGGEVSLEFGEEVI